MECGKKGGRGEEKTCFVLSTHPSPTLLGLRTQLQTPDKFEGLTS